MRDRLTAWWPALLLAALTLLFFYQLAFTSLILGRGDTFAYFYPYWHARNTALLAGSLPLWSPDLFMGVPLLANSQPGTFYPPNWPLMLLSPPDGVRVSILLHVYWALLGAYLLARRVLPPLPGWRGQLAALGAAVVFGVGGYIGAHVEQINQLQGLAWMPWLFLLYDRALARPVRYVPLLAGALALSFFAGHTQTVFITALGLAIYGAATTPLRRLHRPALILAGAGVIALVLVLPQLVPTMELTSVSNRRGGLNPSEAMAFSFNPLLAGRGLLPSYDGMVFSEYVAYTGVIGLGLALTGLTMPGDRRRLVWGALALVGLLLALGEANPLYWTLATLPGFNLFRVPARWLALFALGAALLAGYGLRALLNASQSVGGRVYALIIAVMVGLAAASTLAVYVPERVTGPALPTTITWAGWGLALAVLLICLSSAARRVYITPLLVVSLVIELWLAAGVQPYNLLVAPETYNTPRFTTHQLRVYTAEQTPPGRMLSISELLFDPGDRAVLEARYTRLGMNAEAVRLALVNTKLQEIVAPNLPLVWGVPSIDGFDGGVLPTAHYTAFTSLLLPPDTLRTIDGRLRELLARPECRGACLPDQRWLNLTNTRYVITDKVFDWWHEGIAYDTSLGFALAGDETHTITQIPLFVATALDVYYSADQPPQVSVTYAGGRGETLNDTQTLSEAEGQTLIRSALSQPGEVTALDITTDTATHIHALTLVDTRTGDFIQLAPAPWARVLSSDIKIYENLAVLPRAFVVHEAHFTDDSEQGSEDGLALMRLPDFDPSQTAIIAGEETTLLLPPEPHTSYAEITAYTPERVEISVQAAAPGYLILTDAYYPGWQALLNDEPAAIYRANIMFRAVAVPAGASMVVFSYEPAWLGWLLPVGIIAWLLLALIAVAGWRAAHFRDKWP